VKSALRKLREVVEQFCEVDLGYPKGEHRVLDQKDPDSVADKCRLLGIAPASSLATFYAYCDGIDLPDVGNGYYVLSSTELVTVNGMTSEPNKLALSPLAVGFQSSSSAKMPERRSQELFTVCDAAHVDCPLPAQVIVQIAGSHAVEMAQPVFKAAVIAVDVLHVDGCAGA
jgi:hypothetical protein